MTKKEIQAKLTELGISFDEKLKVVELSALLPETPETPETPVAEESDVKKALRKHIEDCQKRFPAKYEVQKERLQAKLDAIK